MNEIELIRAQLSLERQHAADVSRACASAFAATNSCTGDRLASLEAFRHAGVDYLIYILTRFEEREQVLRELFHSRFAEGLNREAADSALALTGSSREALAKLEIAMGSSSDADSAAHWTEFLRFFTDVWSPRRDELDKLFEQQAKVTDWRAVSGIDADSIYDERRRYAHMRAKLPAGIEMPATRSSL